MHDHLQGIDTLKQRIVETQRTAKEEHTELSRLKMLLDKANAEAEAKFQELANLGRAVERAAEFERLALANLEEVRSEKSWKDLIPGIPTEWKARMAIATTNHEAKKLLTSKARATEAAFRRQLNDSEIGNLRKQVAAQEAVVADIEHQITRLEATLNGDWLERLRLKTLSVLPSALGVLAGIIFAPFFIKAFLYFVIAPQASRIPPVRILAGTSAPPPPSAVPSAVSLTIEVGPDQELLVDPDFLQSSSKPARKLTRYFLNPTLPFSSLASGMTMLTSVRPEGDQPTKVVISATKDALGEVGIVELPEGASMVLQPRALAGVIKPAAGFTRISRHWRLFNLHSWLTLQLRYLVFHGPCFVILKGCRGVRAESPDPARPRILNQSATLGFSSHLDYSNTRCETFWSYFTGKEDLFNDLFDGENGLYIYEEMPDASRKTGITGRGLEGLLDGFLRAFGI